MSLVYLTLDDGRWAVPSFRHLPELSTQKLVNSFQNRTFVAKKIKTVWSRQEAAQKVADGLATYVKKHQPQIMEDQASMSY